MSHPIDFVNVKIKDHLKKDQIFYDNKKDLSKVQNKTFSPEEMADHLPSNSSVSRYERYNQQTSKENLFQIGSKSRNFNSTKASDTTLPLIKSSSTTGVQPDILHRLEQDIISQHRDYINELVHPMKRDEDGKIRRSSQDQQKLMSLKKLNMLNGN